MRPGPYQDPRWNEHVVTPECCEAAQKQVAVYLCFSDVVYHCAERPHWRVDAYLDGSIGPMRTEARFCPYCGTALPGFQKKEKPPSPLCVVTDGGYYCDSCGERLHGCKCLPPDAAWRIIR